MQKGELTNKENEIIRLMAKGLSRKEIASDLGMAYATLDTHLKHIFLKLNTRGTLETVVYVLENKLV